MKPKLFVQAGQRFGRGVVTDPEVKTHTKNGIIRSAGLTCDCGQKYTAYIFNLMNGNTRSCGCLRKELMVQKAADYARQKTVFGRSAKSEIYTRYRKSAEKRDLEWGLSREQVEYITTRHACCYCGTFPSNLQKARRGIGHVFYNGIDRIDNTKGYIADNVVPCCWTCNNAKKGMSLSKFLEWIRQVHAFTEHLTGYEDLSLGESVLNEFPQQADDPED